jgi:hypothetical protein
VEEVATMSRDEREYLRGETVIIGPDGGALARVDGLLWPPIDAKVELGDASRGGVVSDVRLKLHSEHAVVCVTVEDVGDDFAGGAQPS